MAAKRVRRIVVQETCSNGRFHPLEWEEPTSCCDHWPDGDRSHPLFGVCPTASFCDGGSRRVLDPGSYVLIEKVDSGHTLGGLIWPDWAYEVWDKWWNDPDKPGATRLFEALAGGEQP
jgi:hypothetical protein